MIKTLKVKTVNRYNDHHKLNTICRRDIITDQMLKRIRSEIEIDLNNVNDFYKSQIKCMEDCNLEEI